MIGPSPKERRGAWRTTHVLGKVGSVRGRSSCAISDAAPQQDRPTTNISARRTDITPPKVLGCSWSNRNPYNPEHTFGRTPDNNTYPYTANSSTSNCRSGGPPAKSTFSKIRPIGIEKRATRHLGIANDKPTPKEQILFLYILSGQGQLHAYEDL